MEITETHARKFVDLLGHGLVNGLGTPEPGKMCVEAAWCVALGMPHGDDPGCIMESLRRLKIRLNDSNWSSPQARAKGLMRLGLIQIGSDGMDKREFRNRVNTLRIQMLVPIRFRIAAKKQKTAEHRGLLEAAALMLEQEPTRDNCIKARDTASGVYSAAYAAAYAAADADAAAAAYAAAYAAAAAYAYAAAAADAAQDKILADFAEAVVQILIDMKAPGMRFLHLAPL